MHEWFRSALLLPRRWWSNHISIRKEMLSARWKPLMMDIREAVKGLDACSDRLLSLSLLLDADHFRRVNLDIAEMRENLVAELRQTLKDAISLAIKVVGAKGLTRGQPIDPSTAPVEFNAAVGRFVEASNRAGEALEKSAERRLTYEDRYEFMRITGPPYEEPS